MSAGEVQAGKQTNNAHRFAGSSLFNKNKPIGPTISGVGLDDPKWSKEADDKAAVYYKSIYKPLGGGQDGGGEQGGGGTGIIGGGGRVSSKNDKTKTINNETIIAAEVSPEITI